MTTDYLADKAVATNLDLFSAWVEAQMAYSGQPGLSVGIVYDQELVWSHGFGYANTDDKTPTSPQTLYRIASITKLFTSTAIMQLRDAGLLQLDDPVQKHLPWFSIQNPHADTPVVTIRHLLTHAAGLPREAAFPYWSTNEFPNLAEVQEALPNQELAIPTASDWKYSNLGLTLAGEIVATVSGKPYTSYIEENILQPLGMENTFVETVPADHALLATGYGRRLPDGTRAVSPHTDCGAISPAANMASNVEDLAKFAMLQFRSGPREGAQILAGSSLREMHRVQWLNDDWSAGRGIGFYVWRFENRTLVGHGGALQGYRTDLQVAPADKVGVIVLTNADDGQPLLYMQKAFQWIVPALLKAAKPEPTPQEAPQAWERYTGRYRSAWGDLQVLIYNDELVAIAPTAPDPLASMIKLKPVSEHTFRMETKERFGSTGELAVFALDDSGKVCRLHTGNTYMTPIAQW
ncbi:MAG: serine hydrolase [Caldilineaceae bacterium]|nr:serine hydrolase [Caldilineaceae bacterium]